MICYGDDDVEDDEGYDGDDYDDCFCYREDDGDDDHDDDDDDDNYDDDNDGNSYNDDDGNSNDDHHYYGEFTPKSAQDWIISRLLGQLLQPRSTESTRVHLAQWDMAQR